MMYGSETWTLYRHHIKLLRTVQQKHLRSILKIKWDHYTTNDEVLDRSKSTDIEVTPSGADAKHTFPILYGELAEVSRRVGRPLLRCKDTIKDILKCGGALDMWIEIIGDRSAWWRFTSDV